MITFEINGIGFELSLGEIDKSKFEYWKDKEISGEDINENNQFSLFKDHWTDLNDIFHDNGPAMLENTKLEVKEDNKIIFETYLGAQTLRDQKLILKNIKLKLIMIIIFLVTSMTKGLFIKQNLKLNHLKLINY